MPTEDELFAAVDALLEGEPEMPPPAERTRLREAARISQARLAEALRTIDADGEELGGRPLGTATAAPPGVPATAGGVGGEVPRARRPRGCAVAGGTHWHARPGQDANSVPISARGDGT